MGAGKDCGAGAGGIPGLQRAGDPTAVLQFLCGVSSADQGGVFLMKGPLIASELRSRATVEALEWLRMALVSEVRSAAYFGWSWLRSQPEIPPAAFRESE